MANELALFTSSVNQLIESPLIMVNKQIANLLRTVVRLPTLTQTLTETLKTTSYATEFSRARVTLTRPDGAVESRLKLPTDKDRLFAFVVCLLTEVDSGRRNFIDFLKEYYNDSDSNAGFAQFVDQVMKPFKRAGENILRVVDPYGFDSEAYKRAEKFFNAERCYVETSIVNAVMAVLDEMRAKVATMTFDDETQVADAAEMIDAMSNAVQLKNPRILNIVRIGFFALFSKYDEFSANLERLSHFFGQIAI